MRSVCVGFSIGLGVAAMMVLAQAPMASMGQPAPASAVDQNRQLADQITDLRSEVAKLQAAVRQTSSGKKSSPRTGMKMSPGPKKGMASMDDEGEMGGTPAQGGGGMSDPAPAMEMCCMGKMAASGTASSRAMPFNPATMATMNTPSSAMPGQAGSSHLYHIGSNGFFLNHSRHITLTAD